MSPSDATPSTVERYLAALPDDRRQALEALREVINGHLPKGYVEGMQYGMPAWFVPHERYPHGYHCDPKQPLPFVSIASKKSHIGLHLFCAYLDPELMTWFEAAWRSTGARWDAGKSCVRAKRLEDIPLDLVGTLVKNVLKHVLLIVGGSGELLRRNALTMLEDNLSLGQPTMAPLDAQHKGRSDVPLLHGELLEGRGACDFVVFATLATLSNWPVATAEPGPMSWSSSILRPVLRDAAP